MKYNFIKLLLLLLVGLKLNGQSLKNVQAKIYILNACSKQAHISIYFENINETFSQIKDSLTINWIRDGKIVSTTNKTGILATELGMYSCEISFENVTINSNNLDLKSFDNYEFFGWTFLELNSLPISKCFMETFSKKVFLNANGYFFGGPTPLNNLIVLLNEKPETKLNWYVNDILQDQHLPILDVTNKVNTLGIKLLVTDGLCDFISKEEKIFNNEIIIKSNQNIVEFCVNDSAIIFERPNPVYNKHQIYSWYKNDSLVQESINENLIDFENIKLKTNNIGKYVLKNTTVSKYVNGKPIFDENSCVVWTDTITVNQTPLPTASISGDNAIELGQTTDLKFNFTSTPPWQIKLNTGEEFSVQKSPFSLTIKPLTDMRYSINSVKNSCGLGTSTGEALIKVIILADEQLLDENIKLKAYPIPVYDTFEVEIKNAKTKQAEIFLYDFMGKVVLKSIAENQFASSNKTLNINNLPTGLYVLKVNIDGKIIERKILKK